MLWAAKGEGGASLLALQIHSGSCFLLAGTLMPMAEICLGRWLSGSPELLHASSRSWGPQFSHQTPDRICFFPHPVTQGGIPTEMWPP